MEGRPCDLTLPDKTKFIIIIIIIIICLFFGPTTESQVRLSASVTNVSCYFSNPHVV
jgi:hypothetical protein